MKERLAGRRINERGDRRPAGRPETTNVHEDDYMLAAVDIIYCVPDASPATIFTHVALIFTPLVTLQRQQPTARCEFRRAQIFRQRDNTTVTICYSPVERVCHVI